MYEVSLAGHIEANELSSILNIDDPANCQQRLTWLIDMSEVQIDCSTSDIHDLVNKVETYRGATTCSEQDCHVAIIAVNDATFGIMRMISVYLEEVINIRIFRDREQALAWLQANSRQRQLCA